ncbi:MAG: hypothetical protein WDM81_00825 [Rhizomicrobium sp.]
MWKDNRRRHNEKIPTWDVLNKYRTTTRSSSSADATMSPMRSPIPAAASSTGTRTGAVWLDRVTNMFEHAVWPQSGGREALGIHPVDRADEPAFSTAACTP